MNGIGFDYQQTLTMIALREDEAGGSAPLPVGDGTRALIPNAAARGKMGSAALLDPLARPLYQGSPGQRGPWLGQGAQQFWEGCRQRVFACLGRIAPTRENGYFITVALQSTDFSRDTPRVAELARAAGFEGLHCVPATDALLLAWLAGPVGVPTRDGQRELTVAVVVAGDTLTQTAAYRLERDGRGAWTAREACRPAQAVTAGHADWSCAVLQTLHEHMKMTDGERTPFYELALRDATLAWAQRLGEAPDYQTVPWSGPFRELMYSKWGLTPAECDLLPGAPLVLAELPGLIANASINIGGRETPDLVVAGGVGACWPFIARAAHAAAPRVERVGSATEAIARGAALWPLGNGRSITDLVCREASGRLIPEPAEQPAPGRASDAGERPMLSSPPVARPPRLDPDDDLPPWERSRRYE